MSTVTIKLILPHTGGAPTTNLVVRGPLTVEGTELTDHDIAGILFAMEFAINNHASEMVKRPIRAHIDIHHGYSKGS